jgi:hypothetical protein
MENSMILALVIIPLIASLWLISVYAGDIYVWCAKRGLILSTIGKIQDCPNCLGFWLGVIASLLFGLEWYLPFVTSTLTVMLHNYIVTVR